MTLTSLLVFILAAALYNVLVPARLRGWALLIGSIVAIYWLQPAINVRPLDFVLPTATLLIAILGWFLTRPAEPPGMDRETWITLGLSGGSVVILALLGTFLPALPILPSPPPPVVDIVILLAGCVFAVLLIAPLLQNRNRALWIFLILIVLLFALLKSEPLAVGLAGWLRAEAGRPLSLAGVIDVGWLGFSYVAFRLIHTLRDRQTGKLPALTLREYLTYIIFFPAYTAGPIDRAERFVKDYRALPRLDAPRAVEAGGRIAIGVFKKFVLADSLAVFALSASNALQTRTWGGMWLLLYAFAFRLYFDFSGYSDIAIGVGKLFGIDLPENFNLPYLKSNITVFWQSWHATLSGWVRFYVFMPLSRLLLTRNPKPPPTLVVFLAQMSTMIVIGLWHGITLNFVLWGAWHGVGLFIHKLYSDRPRVFYQGLNEKPGLKRASYSGGVLLTFHFVALGWVFFALPDTGLSLRVVGRLFGVGY